MRDEVDDTTGIFRTAPTAGNIIDTLNRVRIYGYTYNQGLYFDNGVTGGNTGSPAEDCRFQTTAIANGTCVSWGNPMSEIYLEALRYFALSGNARVPTSNFVANDSQFISGLPSASWATDPLSDDNRCASLNIVSFNASINSEDLDETGGFGNLPGNPSLQTEVNAIGVGENIHGNSWFIGRTGGQTNEQCTAKAVTSLFDIAGLCPEGPTLEGSYHMAGMAYWARTNDIRPTAIDDEQNVRTFAISLSTSVPTIEVSHTDGRTVNILPAYRLLRDAQGGGALVDFKIVRPHTEVDPADIALNGQPAPRAIPPNPAPPFPRELAGSGIFHGRFYVNWEDSEQGGDFDQDMWGILDYVLNENTGELTVTTTAVAESTSNPQLFGFVIGGTTQDGFHAYSGIESADFNDPIAGVPRM